MERSLDMPILTLKLSANANLKNANALARDLTALSTQVLHKRADVTSVVFQRALAEDWWVGGDAVDQVLVQLDIRVTKGTNTELEKATFIAEAFALLPKHLADGQQMHATSYISVQELAATDWGYGGYTQQQRREMAQTL
jgi:4-oxalocrotonate tautomerase